MTLIYLYFKLHHNLSILICPQKLFINTVLRLDDKIRYQNVFDQILWYKYSDNTLTAHIQPAALSSPRSHPVFCHSSAICQSKTMKKATWHILNFLFLKNLPKYTSWMLGLGNKTTIFSITIRKYLIVKIYIFFYIIFFYTPEYTNPNPNPNTAIHSLLPTCIQLAYQEVAVFYLISLAFLKCQQG